MSAATQGLGELRRPAFPNGLRVVTMRRDWAPLVDVKLFFKVGSRHDGLYSGIAHFLETPPSLQYRVTRCPNGL